ncbi:MAG: aminotransferase class I/II-fold pyridoxal phosphate-dependent enzyme [Desulfobulbaceae bacterium]|nr:aminotransferase class I/II-fold pyridoxal phosphate-dependent enzyme [Desulfobulbaceae bacterium]
MPLARLESELEKKLADLRAKGTLKGKETVITAMLPPRHGKGPRFHLVGHGRKQFLKMNSNSYLGLSTDPKVMAAEHTATDRYGVGPGAVRFISGTYEPHAELETRLARFHGRKSAMIFSAAYATIVGVLPQLIDKRTMVISDELNHNSIINAIRLSRPAGKAIYRHCDMEALATKLEQSIGFCDRIIVVTDGIFSMRGDFAPLAELVRICKRYNPKFQQGVITVVDDSHGVGAFGRTGRGTEEYTKAKADILIATLGKSLGVNGGYVAASSTVIKFLRETAPLYIYSNPITPAEAAAAIKGLDILESKTGLSLLEHLRKMTRRFEQGIIRLGYETLKSENPIVPLLTRDTRKTAQMVRFLFKNGILATGLNFPVVPKGDEEIRFQVSAGHTEKDIDYVLRILKKFK